MNARSVVVDFAANALVTSATVERTHSSQIVFLFVDSGTGLDISISVKLRHQVAPLPPKYGPITVQVSTQLPQSLRTANQEIETPSKKLGWRSANPENNSDGSNRSRT
jgi:hypothetical protein